MAGLRKALRSLPKTLDDTYSRILINIDEEYRREAYTVLQWLTFSVRPLHLVEVAEAVAVRPGSDFLDDEEKLRDPHVILSICSSLVVLSEFGELRLAHYSVKEYLVSERIRTSPASQFAMMVDSGNKDIAEICLTYLLLSDQWDLLSHSRFLDFPLLRYATQNWHVHARSVPAELAQTRVTPLAVQFLTSNDNPAFKQWITISKQDEFYFQPPSRALVGTPLYFASYCGLLEVARLMVESMKDADARSEILGDALKAASNKGHLNVVKLLLDAVAAIDGHEKDDYTREDTVTALQQAAWNGHLDITQLLLNKGADVNAQDPWGTTALHCEAWKGYTPMLKLLLDNGADPETQDGAGGSALHFAAYAGQEEVIRMLLDYGARVDAKAAFHTFVQKSPKVEELGASDKEVFGEAAWLEDRDEGRCPGRTPLHEAAWAGKTGAVRLLVERGADVRAQDDNGWTALHRAAKQGFADTAQLLLDLGSPTDLRDRSEMRMTAYELAAAHMREDVVRALDPFPSGRKSVQVLVCEISVDG
ncbi:hypothetical protein OEA41_001278 [Lepraria neglecta]|uniref:GPI inositol-deacylase winged helix domain-containing protein n=1 Tax=Lepraria neglecta TaxID=209136 RepID=A0AAD9Z9D5_9LECA|nr:hypothetical protein OEA41_001278 [Lepraria neglecta]